MNREILFRAKHVHVLSQNKHFDGIWVYGYLSKENRIFSPELEGEFLIDPKTVCQYTGLTDKRGKKIFEGDIIECKNENSHFRSQIEWDCVCGGFIFQDTREGSAVMLDALSKGGIYNNFKVIGNIYDYPKLLDTGSPSGQQSMKKGTE